MRDSAASHRGRYTYLQRRKDGRTYSAFDYAVAREEHGDQASSPDSGCHLQSLCLHVKAEDSS